MKHENDRKEEVQVLRSGAHIEMDSALRIYCGQVGNYPFYFFNS